MSDYQPCPNRVEDSDGFWVCLRSCLLCRGAAVYRPAEVDLAAADLAINCARCGGTIDRALAIDRDSNECTTLLLVECHGERETVKVTDYDLTHSALPIAFVPTPKLGAGVSLR